MKKRTPHEIIKKIKEDKPERANVTFRLPVVLMERFDKICEKNGVKMTAVLEELIQDFVTNTKE